MVHLHRAPQQRGARAAMTSCARALRLLSLNVNGMRIGHKRLTLFSELLLGNWDIVVLQETHHDDEAEGLAWAREGAGVGKPWLGDTFWSSLPTTPGVGAWLYCSVTALLCLMLSGSARLQAKLR